MNQEQVRGETDLEFALEVGDLEAAGNLAQKLKRIFGGVNESLAALGDAALLIEAHAAAAVAQERARIEAELKQAAVYQFYTKNEAQKILFAIVRGEQP